jgi:hypothetical protein
MESRGDKGEPRTCERQRGRGRVARGGEETTTEPMTSATSGKQEGFRAGKG